MNLQIAGLAALVAVSSGCAKEGEARPPELAQAIARGDDQSRCDYKGRSDVEAVESSSPGADRVNIRRAYLIVNSGEERKKILICREVDTNLDGVKDLIRHYDDHGVATEEEADSNYDGKIDTWVKFSSGHLLKVEIDTDHDGQVDESRFYVRGKLTRVERDTNRDGKPDVWEIYGDGQLSRVGFDVDFDGHVDRWARDEVAYRAAEKKEREAEEKQAQAQPPTQAQPQAAQAQPQAPAQPQAQPEQPASATAPGGKPVQGNVSPRKR